MFGDRTELKIPDAAKADSKSVEILRIWLSDGSQPVSLKTGVRNDPAAWGLLLADLAQHVANFYAAAGKDREATLQRVLDGFRMERESPTDEPSGGICS
jgi:hypothetical protein